MSRQYDHDRTELLTDTELYVRALESLLQEKGLIDPTALDELIDTYEHRADPRNDTQVVAKTWSDPEYKHQLLADATTTIAELSFSGVQDEDMQVVENTPDVYDVTVRTSCSCYLRPVLGLPPVWYKSALYHSHTVIDLCGVLTESGVDIPESKEVRVWDSSTELHYLALPERPAGTDDQSGAQLIELVTRDSMTGAGLVVTL